MNNNCRSLLKYLAQQIYFYFRVFEGSEVYFFHFQLFLYHLILVVLWTELELPRTIECYDNLRRHNCCLCGYVGVINILEKINVMC